MPSISTDTRWPGCTGPTPAGVPVRMTSPGSKVKYVDAKDTNRGTSWTRSAVEPSWTTSPSRRVTRRSADGSRSVTIHGPSGLEVSNPLARAHWPSPRCQTRSDTSLAQV